LANAEEEQTLTITHVLWAMFGLLPPDQEQRPHRHQSVALDLILDAQPGCYTLLGTHLDNRGDIADPTRVDWEAGGAFLTPPGMWHAHFNESGAPHTSSRFKTPACRPTCAASTSASPTAAEPSLPGESWHSHTKSEVSFGKIQPRHFLEVGTL
jgi:hypothetical protein